MKNGEYTHAICRGFCRFYKEGKEELACGTYRFLVRNLTAGEIRSRARHIPSQANYSSDEEIRELICAECDFLVDGCDFREGFGAQPCGGYAIVEWLLCRNG